MAQLYAQLQPFTLYGSGASLGDTTITLTNFNQIDGTPLTMSDFGSIGYMTMEPGSSTQEEQVSFTGVTSNANGTVTLTGVKTVLFVYPYTETSGLAKSHAGATRVVVSNTSAFYSNFTNRLNNETIVGNWTFDELVTVPTGTSLDIDKAASIEYVNSVAVAGAPNASTAAKGIVQLPTQAQVDARTATGSTGASLTPTPANLRTVLTHDYAASTTGTDAYAITLTPTVTAYATGDIYIFKADVANTGAATLNVSALGAKTILAANGATLLDRAITANSINCVVYDGTNFQLSWTTGDMSLSQSGREIYAASTTGNDTYVVTLSPVPLALNAGFAVRFKVDVGNTGPATLNVNGLGAVALVRPAGTALETGDITAGNVITAVYDGTNFQISGLVPAALTAGTTSNADTLHTHNEYSVLLESVRNNVKTFVGSQNDGLTFDSGGGGSGARTLFQTFLDAVAGGGGEASLTSTAIQVGSGSSTPTILNWDALPTMKLFAKTKAADTTADLVLGGGLFDSQLTLAPANATLTARHVAFLTDGATLYASVADGTTQNRSDISSGLTLTNFNLYEIEMTGSSAIFKVNGTVKATLSTNYPTTAGTGVFLSFCTEAAGTEMTVAHPFALELTNLMT